MPSSPFLDCLVDKGKAVDMFDFIILYVFYYFIFYYYFSRAFGTVSHSILNKMSSLQRDMYTILWVNIWLKGQAQKVIVNWVTSG